ncbi:MAG: hypothetical protein MJK07_21435 [Flavobacteriales bacterium]|nr:hypothetical protein [Flavobacteriales bacterium]
MSFQLLGVAFILMHEMDAIRCKEWRIFPGLSFLNDRVGLIVFVFLHVPLFYWVLSEIQSNNDSFRSGFDYFLIVHFILHLLFLMHKKNEFKDWISWTIITGAALFGLLDLVRA